jgi:hypothetical protein
VKVGECVCVLSVLYREHALGCLHVSHGVRAGLAGIETVVPNVLSCP